MSREHLPRTVDAQALHDLIENSLRLRPSTKRRYCDGASAWIAYAGTDPQRWDSDLAEAFYKSICDTRGVSVANALLWGARYAVGRVFQRAEVFSPLAIETAPRRAAPNEEPASLSPEEAQRLLNACDGWRFADERDRAIVLLGLFTGMRRSSLVDVSRDKTISAAGYVGLDVTLKGGSVYRVPIDPRAWQLLAGYQSRLPEPHRHGPFFRSLDLRGQIAGRITPDGLYKAIGTRAKLAGLRFHPHMLRHTFITWCGLAEIPSFEIAVVTGHRGQGGEIDRVYKDRQKYAPGVVAKVWEVVAGNLGLK